MVDGALSKPEVLPLICADGRRSGKTFKHGGSRGMKQFLYREFTRMIADLKKAEEAKAGISIFESSASSVPLCFKVCSLFCRRGLQSLQALFFDHQHYASVAIGDLAYFVLRGSSQHLRNLGRS